MSKVFSLRLTRGGAQQDVQELRQLAFTGQSSNFTAGNTVVGGTSGAKGVLVSQTDAGATGTLILDKVRGTFVNAEALTDTPGAGNGAASGADAFPSALTPADQLILSIDSTSMTKAEALQMLQHLENYVRSMSWPDRAATGQLP